MGNLISQNGQSVGGVKASDLIDTKANYIMRIIDNYFLYDVTEEDYQTAIYRALMNACNDPYSCYYTEEEYASMQEGTSGVFLLHLRIRRQKRLALKREILFIKWMARM